LQINQFPKVITKNPRKGFFKEYRKNLNGKIEYESPTPYVDKFFGFVKLKKDPKIEKLSIDNLLLRGSKIYQTEWYIIQICFLNEIFFCLKSSKRIYGAVVYSGFDTKIMLNTDYGKRRKNHYDVCLQYYFALSILCVLILAAVGKLNIIYFGFWITKKKF
jgi:magnesium-transporting ATPase (P-type)